MFNCDICNRQGVTVYTDDFDEDLLLCKKCKDNVILTRYDI